MSVSRAEQSKARLGKADQRRERKRERMQCTKYEPGEGESYTVYPRK